MTAAVFIFFRQGEAGDAVLLSHPLSWVRTRRVARVAAWS